MAMKIFRALCILALMSTPNIVTSLQKCSCGTTWDCSFREKSIIFPEEQCRGANNWRLQHNKLLTIPRPIPFPSTINVLDVSFNMLGLNESVYFYLNSVTYLDLSSNYLKSLEPLRGSDIQTLVANDNAISNIEISWTVKVRKEIILARNKITTIPPNRFPSTLTYIDLSGNPLSTISKEAFKLLPVLEILHLNDTQQLSEIENGTFDGLTSLKILSLNDNKLTHLAEDLFSKLESLEALSLQANTLSELPLGIFRNQYHLRLLNLDFNQLKELPAEVFSRLHSLEYLSVRNNLLKTLPDLRLCSGPISTVVFTGNLIERFDEGAIRALLRNGFLYGDVSNNLVDYASLLWIEDAKDIILRHPSTDCQTIEMSKLTNHGYILYCPHRSILTTTTIDPFSTLPPNKNHEK